MPQYYRTALGKIPGHILRKIDMTTADDNSINIVVVITPLVTLTIDKLLENLVEDEQMSTG